MALNAGAPGESGATLTPDASVTSEAGADAGAAIGDLAQRVLALTKTCNVVSKGK